MVHTHKHHSKLYKVVFTWIVVLSGSLSSSAPVALLEIDSASDSLWVCWVLAMSLRAFIVLASDLIELMILGLICTSKFDIFGLVVACSCLWDIKYKKVIEKLTRIIFINNGGNNSCKSLCIGMGSGSYFVDRKAVWNFDISFTFEVIACIDKLRGKVWQMLTLLGHPVVEQFSSRNHSAISATQPRSSYSIYDLPPSMYLTKDQLYSVTIDKYHETIQSYDTVE